jgi:DNA replication protein DnaC
MDTSPEPAMSEQPGRFPISSDLGTRAETCDKHGPFESKGMNLMGRREIWSQCPGCKRDAEAAEKQAEADAKADRERKRLDDMLRESGIPERLKGCTFAGYIDRTDAQKTAKQEVSEYFAGFESHLKTGESIILAGKPGTGKGHLAAAGMAQLMPRYLPIYTTCLDMIRTVRETWRKDSKYSESQILQEFEDADLLVIDEIGVQYGTDGEQTIIFDVLDRRYRQMRPTVFITNQDLAGFKGFLGERAYDRLKQTARWVTFDWQSFRPQARKEAA